jgi:transcriptional regulator with XRE-family HTH domain
MAFGEENDYMTAYRNRIREVARSYVENKKMKQVDFADVTGLGKERISAILGDRPTFTISIYVLEHLAKGMGTTIDWLISGRSIYPPPKTSDKGGDLTEQESELLLLAKAVSSNDPEPSRLMTARNRILGLTSPVLGQVALQEPEKIRNGGSGRKSS